LKTAALYDVHGNVLALEAVLAEVDTVGVDRIVFGGDIASGALPRETVELAQSVENALFVLGNADVLASPSMSDEWDVARRWVEEQLDDEQVSWLANLPFSQVVDDVLYVHATPQDYETVITDLTTDEKLAGVLSGVEQPLVVAGHTHMQLDRRVGDRRFVNAGSVGMPYEAEPGAYWALVDGSDVEFRRTEYDLERAAERVRASGHPMAAELADENVLKVPSRAEALEQFGG
jgi:diadenosine tetraphosphatase ApaH/serine/threonine PP2A family protein phosphatase